MVDKVKPKDLDVTIKFGGGLHTRASEDEIDPREAADGQNFLLDLENRELRNRPPFDLIGTVPNGLEIRGGGSLLKTDGTISTIIQAGGVVYEWDGSTGFTNIGTCSATAKLRGHWRRHNWNLDDKLLLTDLALVDVVKEWDGTTFASVAFTDENAAAFGTFYAKYLSISNERAIFSHVKDPGGTSPHMIVGSKQSIYTQITVNNRPSTSLNEQDPFFLLTPDLKPINGFEEAFGTSIVSSKNGRLFNLTGASAKDFAFAEFFAGSAAAGDESLAYIGNDMIYGRQGRIESVRDTNAFGNSEADDLTKPISGDVGDFTEWRIVFNSRTNLAYMFPAGESEVWVFNTAMRTIRSTADLGDLVQASGKATKLSPWMRWTTDHTLAFQPTFVMPMLDPLDGLEYIIMGDASGRVYRLEGSGAAGDGGTSDIATEWLTRLFTAPLDAQAYNIEGYIKYRKNVAATLRMTFEFAGETAFDQAIDITIPSIDSGAPHFGGDYYFGGEVYYGAAFEGRLIRQKFSTPGQGNEFQVRLASSGVTDIGINEIGLRFKIAS